MDYGQGSATGKTQPLEELFKELDIKATVSTWAFSEEAANEVVGVSVRPASAR